ncbi:XdhC family protein [Ornithinibacillus gellani]|uniref:XdhC family protein n=1 Tax=Ornithinibacillus gellani TaxID=2293253 RepID=UPI0016819A20|nr:XdhC family protein [Ornithinibacillus gellani]
MNTIHDLLQVLKNKNDSFVLATIIHVDGSAYRKEGAAMLFSNRGKQYGLISGGCLETDLAYQASSMLQSAQANPEICIYDLQAEDDLTWGRGAGCNGKVHILLEKIDEKLKKQLLSVKKQLDRGQPVIIMTKLVHNRPTVRRTFIPVDSSQIGQRINTQLSVAKQSSQDLDLFIQQVMPNPRLIIFGAGLDAEPLANIASTVGFSVTILDWRENRLKQTNFPHAKLVFLPNGNELSKSISLLPTDFVVLMSHHFQKDRELLQTLINWGKCRYIGVLGPRKRTERLHNGKALPPYIHAPVGMNIKAEGPAEIAISMVAEMIQIQRQQHKKWEVPCETTLYRGHIPRGWEQQTIWK